MAIHDSLTDREVIDEEEAAALREAGALAIDPERSLPFWFDGRFLAARDLLREQTYFLTRQADMSRSLGRGVIDGLQVRLMAQVGAAATRVRITAGHGVAFDGSHLLLAEDVEIDLAEIAVADAVNARLGLSARPAPPARNRSGLFVLSLRPVEFTSNRIASYPTHVGAERELRDGERIEAVAMTLTPFSVFDQPAEGGRLRAAAAAQIFGGGDDPRLEGHALPIAMIALSNGRIEWMDPYLVRRDLTASRRDVLGLGLSQDQLKLAHFHQYNAMYADIVAGYRDAGEEPAFAAREHFRILPAAGKIPTAAIDPTTFLQRFFPPEMEVHLSLAPEDELPAIIDDSFELAPIDLSRGEDLENVSAMILAPVPREILRTEIGALQPLVRRLRPAALHGWGHVKPIERLGVFRLSLADVRDAAAPPDPSASQAAWAALLETSDDLWYVRRRTLNRNIDLESALIVIDATDPVEPPDDPDDPEDPPVDPDSFEERARVMLLRQEGFGAARDISDKIFGGGEGPVSVMFLNFVEKQEKSLNPVLVAAGGFPITEGILDDEGEISNLLDSLLASGFGGWSILKSAFVGKESNAMTNGQLSVLASLFQSPTLAAFATNLPNAEPALLEVILSKLSDVMRTGDVDSVDNFLQDAIREVRSAAIRPADEGPGRGDAPGPSGGDRPTEPIAVVDIDGFVRGVKDPVLAKAFASRMRDADPKAADGLVRMLDAAGAGRSRIAMGTVLKTLGGGSPVTATSVKRVGKINKEMIDGVMNIEPMLLPGAPAGAVARPVVATPVTRASNVRLSRSLAAGSTRNLVFTDAAGGRLTAAAAKTAATDQRRLGLLLDSGRVARIGDLGAKLNATGRKKAAKVIVKALDAQNATGATVKKTIDKAHSGMIR